MHKSDLIIIGGGVLGAFHAYHALLQGLTVQLFEKNNRPQGATVRNFGQVVPSGMNTQWQAYGRRSLEIYKQLQQQTDLTVRPFGSVYFASDDGEMTLLEELYAINQSNSYPSVLLTKAECLARYPHLQSDYCRGGLFFPEEISVESRNMIHRLLDYLVREQKLDYHPATLIQKVEKVNGQCEVSDHSGKKYFAEKVIICSGDDFKSLFPEIFHESDLEISKLQMLQTVPQPALRIPGNILTGWSIRRYESFQECPSYATVRRQEDPAAYWKKWGIHILFKQNSDGSVIIGDSHEYADARQADEIGFDIYPEVNDYILSEARKIFHLEDWNIRRSWYGVYSQCKTSDIFLKTVDRDIHIVTGIGGKGMTGSAGFSEANLAQITGRHTPAGATGPNKIPTPKP